MARRHRRRRRRGGGVTAIMVNPRRRRRRRSFVRARRRNPSGFFADFLVAGIPALVGGGALAFADASFLPDKSVVVRVGSKVVLAGLLGFALRKRPTWAAAGVATVLTAAVMTEVTRLIAASNGKDVAAGKQLPAGAPLLAAGTAAATMKALVREDGRAMGVLVQRNGMGAVLDTNVSLGAVNDGGNALPGTHFQDVSLGTG